MDIILTPKEQLLMKELKPNSVVETRIIRGISIRKGIARRGHAAIDMVRHLAMKKALYRIKRGLYYVSMDGSIDPYAIAAYAFDGYISFESALFLYGYSQTVSQKVFTAIGGNRNRSRNIGNYVVAGVPVGSLAFGFVYWKDYRIASKAKALFDCAYKIWLINDIAPLIRLAASFGKPDCDELLRYLDMVENTLLKERVGLIMEKARAGSALLKRIEGAVHGERTVGRLLPQRNVVGRLNGRWHIYDNSAR